MNQVTKIIIVLDHDFDFKCCFRFEEIPESPRKVSGFSVSKSKSNSNNFRFDSKSKTGAPSSSRSPGPRPTRPTSRPKDPVESKMKDLVEEAINEVVGNVPEKPFTVVRVSSSVSQVCSIFKIPASYWYFNGSHFVPDPSQCAIRRGGR